MIKQTYPEIQKLIDCCRAHPFTFEVIQPTRINQDGLYDEEVKMVYKDQEFIIPVDNEYGDVEINNPIVFLDMILREIEYFEESENFIAWLSVSAELSKNKETINFYRTLKQVAPIIRSIVGKEVKSVPYFEIELDTGMAKALRSSTL